MSDSEGEETPVQHVNIVLVGDANVGKTSLIRRFCFDDFFRQYIPTSGAEFYIKRLLLPCRGSRKRKQEVVLKLTDIGGRELKAQMLDKYLFKADMIVLVYDITNTDTFEHLHVWIETINALITSPPLSAIIGNKSDLEHQRVVSLDRTRQFIKEHGFYTYLTSAKTGEQANMCVMELVAKYLGIPLEQLKKEEPTVLRAELVADKMAASMHRRRIHTHHTKTGVCSLQ